MKNIILVLTFLFSFSAYSQNQKIALHAGDTLEVSTLKRGTDRLFFKRNGQRSQIPLHLVASFYDGHDWVEIVKVEESIMVNKEAPTFASQSVEFHLDKAGNGLILSGAGFVLFTAIALVSDNPDLQIAFGVGSVVALCGGLISAGVNLKRAAEEF